MSEPLHVEAAAAENEAPALAVHARVRQQLLASEFGNAVRQGTDGLQGGRIHGVRSAVVTAHNEDGFNLLIVYRGPNGWPEGCLQRRAQSVRAGWLVGRGVRRQQRICHR